MNRFLSYLDVSHFVTAILTAISTWIWGIPKRRKEKVAREKAEAEVKNAMAAQAKAEANLLLIKRRGDAPFLKSDDAMFNNIYEANGPEVHFWSAGNPRVLCWLRGEVAGVKANEPVIFLVKNVGKAAPQVSIKLDGESIRLLREPDVAAAHGFYFLKYPYNPEKHGQIQRLLVQFVSESGFEDTHIYELIHGHRTLHRVDPP
jgi:hypothetical protein